jgi:uncharacterized membrane protein YqiK
VQLSPIALLLQLMLVLVVLVLVVLVLMLVVPLLVVLLLIRACGVTGVLVRGGSFLRSKGHEQARWVQL